MKKQDKIQFRREEDLAAIDDHLDEAITQLSAANERIGELLDQIDGKAPAPDTAASPDLGNAASEPEPGGAAAQTSRAQEN